MRVVFLGPPGAGKGTQAKLLAESRKVVHLSTGDMLRTATTRGTPTGLRAKAFMDRGALVPDDVVDALVSERLREPDTQSGFLLDGYPRTLAQAKALSRLLADRASPLGAVLYLDVGDDALVRRAVGRRSCGTCGAIFHLDAKPPARAGICDSCGGALRHREDDAEAVVRERLRVYREKTAPLVTHYGAQGLLRRIDGDRPIADVTAEVLAAAAEVAA